MTPEDLIAHRARLGMTAADLGRALRMPGRDPGAYVRKWENGVHPIPGPVSVAVELLTRRNAKALQITQEQPKLVSGTLPRQAFEHAVAVARQQDRERRAVEDMPPAPKALTELMQIPKPKTRRRG